MEYNPNNKEHILIYKKFFKEFGKTKNYEFRKLSKGITSGKKYFFDPETFEYLGTATLKTVAANPIFHNKVPHYPLKTDNSNIREISYNGDNYHNCIGTIPKSTYDFVKDNYIDKNIEFIVYKISDVENQRRVNNLSP